MSNTPSPLNPPTEPAPAESPVASLNAEEMAVLDREDVQAGKAIARLLCVFFLYTIVVTAVAGWWTWEAIG